MLDLNNIDMTGYVGNPLSLWSEDDYMDYIEYGSIVSDVESGYSPVEKLKDFWWLLNNGYLEKDPNSESYRPNPKWIDKYAVDVTQEED